ncbi:MAG: halocyanin domain-containing protein [Halobacteriales archaeon]|nr:halocyanin domain-containing protein [Halobacteriales archaeon]
MSEPDRTTPIMHRRTLLKGIAGSAATAAALSGPAAAQTGFGGWLSETSNYDGTVADRTGQSEVTVEVGAEGNGDFFAFAPPAVQVDPGTTVVFEWTGKGGMHNVHAAEGASFTSETTDEAGFTFEHTFESEGVVKYQCDPHAALGMKGVVVAGALPEGTPTDGGGGDAAQPDWGDWFTAEADGGADETYTGETADRRGEDEVTVGVGTEGNGDFFAFEPSALWIDPGTTVKFEWTGKGGGHNVVSQDGPADLDSGDPVSEAGVNYEYTFEESGINTYYCLPHLGLGMKGGIAVGDDVPTAQPGAPSGGGGGGGGGGEGGGRPLPGGDIGAAFLGALFGATGLAISAVFAGELYRWYRSRESVRELEEGAPEEPWTGVVEEIGHDEFNPFGTAWLVALYFVILLVLWVFMYFVEFLGNGPTVVG